MSKFQIRFVKRFLKCAWDAWVIAQAMVTYMISKLLAQCRTKKKTVKGKCSSIWGLNNIDDIVSVVSRHRWLPGACWGRPWQIKRFRDIYWTFFTSHDLTLGTIILYRKVRSSALAVTAKAAIIVCWCRLHNTFFNNAVRYLLRTTFSARGQFTAVICFAIWICVARIVTSRATCRWQRGLFVAIWAVETTKHSHYFYNSTLTLCVGADRVAN